MNDVKWFTDHIVDLTKTPWDKEKSKPEKGEFVFTGAKVYQRRGSTAPWKFGFWIRYAPPYRELTSMPAQYQISPVKAADCLAWPEGLAPNVEGYYQFDDVILAKEPMRHFLERRSESVAEIDRTKKAAMGQFEQEAESAGVKAEAYAKTYDV